MCLRNLLPSFSASSSALEKALIWWIRQIMRNTFDCIMNCVFFFKFSFGGLAPSADLLRLIEEIHDGNDNQLQNSFQVYDSCSGIRILFSY
jgi:hypothetical protein